MTPESTSLENPLPVAAPAEPTPLCMHMRSKRMYIQNTFEAESQANEEIEHCYGHYWCLQTGFDMGPDDQRVHRKECKPGRSCYEAL